MLDVKTYVYGLLSTNSPLLAALGSVNQIMYYYPHKFDTLPIVTYSETNQKNADDEYFDDLATGIDSEVQIDVWTRLDTSTTTIVKLVDTIMSSAFFNIDFSGDFPEPENRIQHRVLKYSRKFIAGDI